MPSGNQSSERPAFFSLFTFTADLRPDDLEYRKVLIAHVQQLADMGYAGFDLPIAPGPPGDHRREVESYLAFKEAAEAAGLKNVEFATNVGATPGFDPTSPDRKRRQAGLDYLKSRVEITAALGGELMAGPIVFPYNAFPSTDTGEPIWSDALQEWLGPGYRRARPVMNELGDYARAAGVKLAIEPVDHWETPAPNLVGEVMDFLHGVDSRQVGVCVDVAHCMLGGGGPKTFGADIERAAGAGRLHYLHISAPDRGAIHDSWIPWQLLVDSAFPRYDGPVLLEVFNAIPAFQDSLRLTRRKFWIPGEDPPDPRVPDAYTVARRALATFRDQLSEDGNENGREVDTGARIN